MSGAERPVVSVLTAAYNVAEVLGAAVRSALDQDLPVEVIVIDDHSTDGTVAMAAELARQHSEVRIVRLETNQGPGAARSRGLLEARGEWIAVLDADDTMAPARLDRLVRLVRLARERGLDFVADNLTLRDPMAGPVKVAFPLAPSQSVEFTPERVLRNAIPGGRVNLGWMKPLVRREFLLLHDIAWRPIRHGEDMLFTIEVLLAGARAELIGTPGYIYTQRRGTITGAASAHSRRKRNADEQIKALEIRSEISMSAGRSAPG